MRNHYHNFTFLLTVLLAASTPHCTAQTPAIAPGTPFTVPLANNTTATAIVLPGPNNQAWLVYATSTGQIGLSTLSITTVNPPPPTPTPPPSPVNPPIPVFPTLGPTPTQNCCPGGNCTTGKPETRRRKR